MDSVLELTISVQSDRQSAPSVIVLRTDRRGVQDTSTLHEDDRCTITLRSPSSLGIPMLVVQGYELEDGRLLQQYEGVNLWRWGTDPNMFRNCFGLTVFRVEFEDGRSVEFQPVEVLARKLKAEHTRNMLEYLWRQSPELVYACFARTSAGGAFGEGSPSVERILRQAESVIDSVERLAFSSRSLARKRLVEHMEVKPLGAGDVIDDRSVHFVLQNLQYATPTPSSEATVIRLQYRSLYLDSMAVVRKAESTDVYENRVVHGLLWTVERRLMDVAAHLENVIREIEFRRPFSSSEEESYARFQTVCGYYIHQVAKRPLTVVGDLLKRVRLCKRRLSETMPAKAVLEVPRLTPTFSVKPHYRAIFRRAHEWYQMGDGLASVSDVLMGLRTIDRLFEYYCLFTLLDLTAQEGWRIVEARREHAQVDSPLDSSLADTYRLFHDSLGHLELLYEPSIPPIGSGRDLWGLVKVSGSSVDSFRPDFVLRWSPSPGTDITAVLDAKYSADETIKYRHLPTVALKYLFGVRNSQFYDRSPFDYLCLIGPTSRATPLWDFHYQARGLGIRPAIHVARAHPGEDASGLENWLKQVLFRRQHTFR